METHHILNQEITVGSTSTPHSKQSTIKELTLSESLARKALDGFMPFCKDPEKHQAYRDYLKYHAKLSHESPILKAGWNDEFYKAAKLFQPLPPSLSRFARSTDQAPADPNAPLFQKPAEPEPKPSCPASRISDWKPATGLLKRFGLPSEHLQIPQAMNSPLPTVNIAPAIESAELFRRPAQDLFQQIFH